ncbi:hypothetical protein Vretifemale_17100, partial [Volvox reticuliferus]
ASRMLLGDHLSTRPGAVPQEEDALVQVPGQQALPGQGLASTDGKRPARPWRTSKGGNEGSDVDVAAASGPGLGRDLHPVGQGQPAPGQREIEAEENLLCRLFDLEPGKMQQMLAAVSVKDGAWQGIVRVPPGLSVPTSSGMYTEVPTPHDADASAEAMAALLGGRKVTVGTGAGTEHARAGAAPPSSSDPAIEQQRQLPGLLLRPRLPSVSGFDPVASCSSSTPQTPDATWVLS